MKRRNAESGKMRRPVKRTKITEGMYGSSMLYLKFVMLWATVVVADYMLDFRFEFLWPCWMTFRSVYDSFRYQGLAFSVFFVCIALTSDLICYFFIPVQYIFVAASSYVWVQCVWYIFSDRGLCVPTALACCLALWGEGAVRGGRGPALAAHCVGFPAAAAGLAARAHLAARLRVRTTRRVRRENEFYFQLLRDALPETALDQSQQHQASTKEGESETRQPNGSTRRKSRLDNSFCPQEQAQIQLKLDKLEKHLAQQTAARDKSASAQSNAHCHSNGHVSLGNGALHVPPDEDDRTEHYKGSAKSSRCKKAEEATITKEEKRKNRSKDKDKETNDSNKITDLVKEQILKEVESTKDYVKNKECNGYKEKEREKERDKEREKEKDKDREHREKDAKDIRESRSWSEEVRRLRAEVAAARGGEAHARRALDAAAAAHRALRHRHAQLHHKVSTWRDSERTTSSPETRTRTQPDTPTQPSKQTTISVDCDSECCKSRRTAQESEMATLRRDLDRAKESVAQLQNDLSLKTEQMSGLEACVEEARLSAAALRARGLHLERALSAETRVKLDLLSALGDAKRRLLINADLISKQEKELEELKAQLVAVMPAELLAAPDRYTPKQLCSDA